MKRSSINRRLKSEYLQKVLQKKDPKSFLTNKKRTVGPKTIQTMNNVLFITHNNFHKNSKLVLDERTRFTSTKKYDRKSFFVKITGSRYKCLICNSYVKRILKDGYEIFTNPNGEYHRQKLFTNQERGVVCIFNTKVRRKKREKHIGHMKPQDNSFMTIEDV